MMRILTNTPKFKADLYRDARPLYPREIFRSLERALPSKKTVFLDLACGAGQSTLSFLGLGCAETGFAVDPDPEMREAARSALEKELPAIEVLAGSAEKIPLPNGSVDLVLVGSAIHWFDISRARVEIERVLRTNGILFVFEYQFPKCLDHAELAETVRRRFNLEWKAPVQKPRGSLAELLLPFRNSSHWSVFAEDRPEWIESLSLESFLGHLFSQSRYLHAEAAAPDPKTYREAIAAFFRPYFEGGPLRFDLKPRVIGFKKTASL